MEYNKIYCADCIELMGSMEDECIDCIITSPPYDSLRDYKGYSFDCEAIASGFYRILKPGGVAVWVVGDAVKKGNKTLTSFRHAFIFQNSGFNCHDVMIYKKKNTPFMRSNAYTNCFEYMFIFSKGSPKTFESFNKVMRKFPLCCHLHEILQTRLWIIPPFARIWKPQVIFV